MDATASAMQPLPARAGIGLRAPHMRELLESRPPVAWLEVHSENYFAAGGRAATDLMRVREHYPLSLHGVGLSLGSTDPLDRDHLAKLKGAVERFSPMLVSEHLCWVSVGGAHFHDLLPLPYTEEAVIHVAGRIGQVQEYLGRRILIENVSSYLEFESSAMPEWEFLREVATRADCGILLDVNNVYVSAKNHGFDARQYIDSIPGRAIGEIHLAGHMEKQVEGVELLLDTHDRPVKDEVWELYGYALQTIGPRPTLLEWDNSLPSLTELLSESAKAECVLVKSHAAAA